MLAGNPPDYAAFKPLLLDILYSAHGDLTEHELLRAIAQKLPYFDITGMDTLALFHRHFLLFHCLYRLQQDLWRHQAGHLTISALAIRITPYQSVQGEQLAATDPLRTYYMDLNNLTATHQSELDEMLAGFWQRLLRQDSRTEALAILGLADPVSDTIIKQRYRELVMTHHPDRGGDTARIQILNAAMAELSPKRGAK